MIYFPIDTITCVKDHTVGFTRMMEEINEMAEWIKQQEMDCWLERMDEYSGMTDYALVFRNPNEAMLFKLTWM